MYSVVIVTYNSAEVVGPCIRSVKGGCRSGNDVEVIVVDNASTDTTVEIVAKEFPDVVLIRNPSNEGFAAGANAGAKKGHGDFFVFLNADVEIGDGFFEELSRRFGNDQSVAIVGTAITDLHGRRQRSCWREPSLFTVAAEALLPYELAVRLVTLNPKSRNDVPMVSGAALAVRSSVFRALGGFDERFFMYYEDADLCLRARQAGKRVLYTDGTAVKHHVSQSFGGDLTDFFLHVYTSKMKFFQIHHPVLMAVMVRWLVILGIAIRVPLYGIAGLFIGSCNLRRLAREHARVLPRILKRG